MAVGNNWLEVLCFEKYTKIKTKKYFFEILISFLKFKNNVYICTHKKGHVAQLNSALDYGSRGCWFESSRGHKSTNTIKSVCAFLILYSIKNQYFSNSKIIKKNNEKHCFNPYS
jgi:hypothetical protein